MIAGLLIITGLCQWNITVLDTGGYGWPNLRGLFLRDGRWPVVVSDLGDTIKVFRYEGVWPWALKILIPPENSTLVCRDFTLDSHGNLHVASLNTLFDPDTVYEYVENGFSWDSYWYHEDSNVGGLGEFPYISVVVDNSDTSHMFYPVDIGPNCIYHLRRYDATYTKETLNIWGFGPEAQLDSSGGLWVFHHTGAGAFCLRRDGGWVQETVEVNATSNFYYNSVGPYLTIRGTAYALYKPHGTETAEDTPHIRFAWRRADGAWHYGRLRGFHIRGFGVDNSGLIHGLAAFREDSFAHHVVRDTASLKWDTLEVVDSVNGIEPAFDWFWNGGFMLVDADGHLHAAYVGKNGKLCYATTRPDVGVSEPPVEPKPSLFLSVSPNPTKGLFKLQYGIPLEDEGLVSLKIYDVSGRAIQTIFSEEKSAGYYDLSIPTSSFQAGTYFLRMETETKALTEKIILR